MNVYQDSRLFVASAKMSTAKRAPTLGALELVSEFSRAVAVANRRTAEAGSYPVHYGVFASEAGQLARAEVFEAEIDRRISDGDTEIASYLRLYGYAA